MRQEPDAELLARLRSDQLTQAVALRLAQERCAQAAAYSGDRIVMRVHLRDDTVIKEV